MGRTEGFKEGTLERTQDGQIVPDGEAMDDLTAAIDPVTTPTAQAIENRTDQAGGGPTTDTAPIVVSNNTQAAPPAPSEEPHIAVMPARIRTANSSIQRFQDKRFA